MLNSNQLVSTFNRKVLAKLLLTLNAEIKPLWGKMKPQEMVEHLINQVQYTNGKKERFCEISEEKASLAKQDYIYGDRQIPRNITFGEAPGQLVYPDIESAVAQLINELEGFDNYFRKTGMTAIHGGFGAMNYKEWVFWHSKHFKHHLEQFGLIH